MSWLPENISTYGGDIDALFYFIYYLTGGVFILVAGVLVYYLIRYRDRGDGRRAIYSHGNNSLEIVWTTIPALIFLGLGLSSTGLWAHIKQELPPPDVVVRIDAHQFNWLFTYPGPDGEFDVKDIELKKPKKPRGSNDIESLDALVVPVNQVVQLNMNSVDVLHSLFLPHLRFKQDTVPGREIRGWFEATKTGTYEIACAELCGIGHTGMRAELFIVSEEDWKTVPIDNQREFTRWIIERRKADKANG